MFVFLKRLRSMLALAKAGRGEELDRVLLAIDHGAQFKGASGVMLLELAKDQGWNEHWMTRDGRQALSDDLLGQLYAKKVSRYIRDTRKEPVQKGLER
ncbi:hypothetical protein HOP60_09900 [Halomonas daqingensis]|uniref:Uncharacterized protein n=1 Tax=Billgrantia desiderata TaxID=52021 RepID=A0ABS9B5X0_9GAMM|nr:hypothetical protein [Halomonas desiderata]MCE8042466.1 hypothetical protein [Halomonas desiderata]MCE8047041.1 hypothetical protein [Halomonas desiderata]